MAPAVFMIDNTLNVVVGSQSNKNKHFVYQNCESKFIVKHDRCFKGYPIGPGLIPIHIKSQNIILFFVNNLTNIHFHSIQKDEWYRKTIKTS